MYLVYNLLVINCIIYTVGLKLMRISHVFLFLTDHSRIVVDKSHAVFVRCKSEMVEYDYNIKLVSICSI